MMRAGALGMALAIAATPPAWSQSAPRNTIEIEAATTWQERGLTQSQGRAAVQLAAGWAPADRVQIDATLTTLRTSARHGGSELGLVVAPRLAGDLGAWRWRAGLAGHVFDGRGKLAYGELQAGFDRTLGPAQLAIGADYAPPQQAIGGDNLHLHAVIASALPGTAFTVHAGGGYSLGKARSDGRAWRLRPEGDYGDIHAGIAHVSRRVTLGLRATATIGSRQPDPAAQAAGLPRRDGARLIGYLRLTALP